MEPNRLYDVDTEEVASYLRVLADGIETGDVAVTKLEIGKEVNSEDIRLESFYGLRYHSEPELEPEIPIEDGGSS